MGAIVFWTLVRILLVIPALWVALEFMDFKFWWTVCILAVYGIVIHPAVIHYRLFEEKNREIIETTLCSSCKHFDKSAVLCMKYDKHPTKENLPCEGLDWEPKSTVNEDILK
jgi:hypothetical protein